MISRWQEKIFLRSLFIFHDFRQRSMSLDRVYVLLNIRTFFLFLHLPFQLLFFSFILSYSFPTTINHLIAKRYIPIFLNVSLLRKFNTKAVRSHWISDRIIDGRETGEFRAIRKENFVKEYIGKRNVCIIEGSTIKLLKRNIFGIIPRK